MVVKDVGEVEVRKTAYHEGLAFPHGDHAWEKNIIGEAKQLSLSEYFSGKIHSSWTINNYIHMYMQMSFLPSASPAVRL